MLKLMVFIEFCDFSFSEKVDTIISVSLIQILAEVEDESIRSTL